MWITGTKRNILVLFALESGFISMLIVGSKIELIDGHRDKEIWYGGSIEIKVSFKYRVKYKFLNI